MLKFKRATVGKHTKSPVKKKGGKVRLQHRQQGTLYQKLLNIP